MIFGEYPQRLFAEQVMKTLPFLRNKLAGQHGQGASVIDVPPVYGELAIQLAGAFHNFLLSKHLARQPRPTEPLVKEQKKQTAVTSALDDEIPF